MREISKIVRFHAENGDMTELRKDDPRFHELMDKILRLEREISDLKSRVVVEEDTSQKLIRHTETNMNLLVDFAHNLEVYVWPMVKKVFPGLSPATDQIENILSKSRK